MVKTIMIMHNDSDTRVSIKTLLEKNGYDVIEVGSFDEFLKKINKRIDLILIDGFMLKGNVLKICKKKKLKILYFLTEEIDESELELYENVVGFIDGPQDIEEFLKKIKSLIG